MLKDNLKMFREEKGYSKLKLARESGVTARCIENIEHGKTNNPRIKTIEALATAVDKTVADLIK